MGLVFPNLRDDQLYSSILPLEATSDGMFKTGYEGVKYIGATKDGKMELVGYESKTLARIISSLGQEAIYPVEKVVGNKPIKGVLMDLDGTSVHSEAFWIWIIEQSLASLMNDKNFKLSKEDVPYVSGHSVSEHLQYGIEKYCRGASLNEAKGYYFEHTEREMSLILKGEGRKDAFTPAPGLGEFLKTLKSMNIKIGLVTSGLFDKAWPEVVSAFDQLKLGDPKEFYDTIITAGYPLRAGQAGTLGELSPKPHPWLYAEAARIGLGIEDKDTVLAIEDSGAGVCSIRLAGFTTVGISGGNIIESGVEDLCHHYCNNFNEILSIIKSRQQC